MSREPKRVVNPYFMYSTLLIIAAGIFGLGFAARLVYQSYTLSDKGIVVLSTVENVDSETVTKYDSNREPYQVETFYSELVYSIGNKEHVYKLASRNPDAFPLGKKIEVVVDPENPSRVRTNTASDHFGRPLVAAGFGAFFIWLGFWGRRHERANPSWLAS